MVTCLRNLTYELADQIKTDLESRLPGINVVVISHASHAILIEHDAKDDA